MYLCGLYFTTDNEINFCAHTATLFTSVRPKSTGIAHSFSFVGFISFSFFAAKYKTECERGLINFDKLSASYCKHDARECDSVTTYGPFQ
jgi:hypothetical protein